MVKGAAIRFRSYYDTVPKLLALLKVDRELRKYDKIVIKPFLHKDPEKRPSLDFVEAVTLFCLDHKNPVAEVFIAEGADGEDTLQLFEELGYTKLAEKHNIGLIDLNYTETTQIETPYYKRFDSIHYPQILSESFVIPLTKLSEDEETGFTGSLASMLGAFPASHYKGFFSRTKTKLRKWPIEYAIHDITQAKLPEFAVIDASERDLILAGQPFEIDKQAARNLSKDPDDILYLKLLQETLDDRQLEKEPEQTILE